MSPEFDPQLITIRDWLRFGASWFNEHQLHFGHGTDNAWDEALCLILYALYLPPDSHPQVLDARLTVKEKQRIFALFERRVTERIPAPYLTGQAFFCQLKFAIDRHVLIPRSSFGEIIQQQFSPWVESSQVHRVLDLCTGSGCIAIAAALALLHVQVDAVDICAQALKIAQRNVTDYGLTQRVRLVHADLFSGLRGERYDLILSNPPYVSEAEMAVLPAEYRYEPKLGLYADDEGLAIVRHILQEAANFLTPQGVLMVEVGNREAVLQAQFPNFPFTWLEFEQSEGGVFLLTCEQLNEING